jgi:hypothetical protein
MKPFPTLKLISFVAGALLLSCHSSESISEPAIQITAVPPRGQGDSHKFFEIRGTVSGATARQKVVVYALAGTWWVQPTTANRFAEIEENGSWRTATHPGSDYAALLVGPEYRPPSTIDNLPKPGGLVLAVTVSKGSEPKPPVFRTIHFSGYEWELADFPTDRGGAMNEWDPSNVFVDVRGLLHLRISKSGHDWRCAEVILHRGLGYGSYRFVVHDVSHLEPGAVFTIYDWDGSGPHEMDIEMSRWGQPGGKNAGFVVQPYYLPTNVVRFMAPEGTLIHSFQWEPGKVNFRTVSISESQLVSTLIHEHTFGMGVPTPGNDSIRIALYRFENRASPLQKECEVVVEKFEYLP